MTNNVLELRANLNDNVTQSKQPTRPSLITSKVEPGGGPVQEA